MPQFKHTSLNAEGRQITGLMVANSRETAILNLRQQNLKPLRLEEVKPKHSFGRKKIKLKDLVVFTRELSTMIDAGVPLPRGLDTLAQQTENKYFKKVVNEINHDVESGNPLADAMAKHPQVFSEVYINMVRAGEAGGILADIMKRLAMQVEKDASIRHKIRSAMAYPIVILTITVVAFFGIMLFVLPKIGKILVDLGGPDAEFPIYTKIMLGISDFLTSNSLVKVIPNSALFILAFIPGAIFLRRYIRTPKGQYQFHAILLKVPVLKTVITKIAVARFARTFASLMGSGVTVLESLEVTGKAIGNRVIQKELLAVAQQVKNGQPLGKQLIASSFFPPIVGQMITVGEETGKTSEILVKVADFYEEEVDTVIDSLTSIIEPLMIILLGGIVGLIAASVMGPIAGLSKNIGG